MTHTRLHRLSAIAESNVTRIIRRAEIYEADGSTLWMPSELTPRLVGGNVTVDYDREERRAMDIELDNKDGVLKHDPDGFWYDKVIKIYRGFQYEDSAPDPDIAIVSDRNRVLERFLRRLGFSNIDVIPRTDTWDEAKANNYDLVVGADTTTETNLNPNPGFETNTTGWFAFGGSLARITNDFYSGGASGQLTPDGVTSTPVVGLNAITGLTAGKLYTTRVRVKAPLGWSRVRLVLAFYNSSDVLLSAPMTGEIDVPPGEWVQLEFGAVAPKNTAKGSPRVWMSGTPAATDLLRVDDMGFYDEYQASGSIDRVRSAFLWGVPVLHVGFIGTVDPPFIATKDTQATPLVGLKQFTKPTKDNALSNGWGSFSSSATTEPGHFIRTLTSGSTSVLTGSSGGTYHNAIMYRIQATDSRWFYYKNLEHLQAATVNPNVVRLFRNAMEWLGSPGREVVYEKQIGEFMIDRIGEDHFPTRIKVTGRDYWKKLQKTKFINSTAFSAGKSVDSIVQSIASNAGITKFKLGAGGKSLVSEITFDRLTSRGDAIKELCNTNGIEVFFDAEGWLVTRPFRDPVTSPASLILQTGKSGNLVSYAKSASDSSIYNVVVVTGESDEALAGGSIIGAYVENNEPNSPTRVSRIGARLWDYSSALFQTNDQAWEFATARLAILALEEFELTFQSIVYPWLEVGDVVAFADPRPGEDEPAWFLLTNIEIPVALGPMSGTAKRISIVGHAEDRGIVLPETV